MGIKKFIFFSLFLLGSLSFYSQIPTTCFEIESILVDACSGAPGDEGNNEMVRFRIGPNDMNVGALDVSWATTVLDWEGTIQNAGTANTVNALNASVENCGVLIEPVNGILPSGARILLVTSYDMNPLENSFENLNDTLYIIFQDIEGTIGHFGNYSASGIRTLEMTFVGPGGCTDQVSYQRNQLIDQLGNTGSEDGATVNYEWDGTATYTNLGCQAPITPFGIEVEVSENSICAGDVIDLSAITINGSTNVIWSGGEGDFDTQNVLETSYQSSVSDNEPFYLVASIENSCDFMVADSILISINPAPSISVSPQDASICGSETVTLTAAGGIDYTWSTGETGNSIEVNSLGVFYAIDNSCGVDTAFTEIVSGGVSPTAFIDAELSFCSGQSIFITASGGVNYLWNDASTNEILEISESGTYSVIVSDLCGSDTTEVTITEEAEVNAILSGDLNFCTGNSLILTASGGVSYEWSTGETTESITISEGGIYNVTATAGNCSDVDNIDITEHNPSIDLGNDIESCTFDSLLEVIGFDSYEWQDGTEETSFLVSEPGIYSLEVTDEFGCTANDEIIFSIGSIVLDLGLDKQACTGETVTLFASSLADGIYEWQDGSTNDSFSVTQSGIYSVEIEAGFCSAQDEVEVTFYNPTAFFELDDTEGCSPVVIGVQDQSSTPYGIITSWNWDFGDGNLSPSQNIGHQYINEGSYSISLQVTTSDGCIDTFTEGSQINVFSTPQADFNFVQEQTEEGLEVQFDGLTDPTSYWNWSFGDNSISDQENPFHIYSNSGSYLVTLTVGLENGCSSEITKNIVFEPEHFIYIPTAFTPDDDGVNDYFYPIISGGTIATYELSIFSRTGQRIFSTKDPNQIWMGGKNSAKYYVQNDVYVYKLEVLFEGEAEKTVKQGVVTVLR